MPPTSTRPYRSHRLPACDRCRKRKLRCTVDREWEPCLMCRLHGTECLRMQHHTFRAVHGAQGHISALSSMERGGAALGADGQGTDGGRIEGPEPDRCSRQSPLRHLSQSSTRYGENYSTPDVTQSVAPNDENLRLPMIVGPDVADDAQIIEQNQRPESQTTPSPLSGMYRLVSGNKQKPVLYTSVPRRRHGFDLPLTPGKMQRDILEEVFRPYGREVISLYVQPPVALRQEQNETYFDKVHPCFPVLDEQKIFDLYESHSDSVSPTLICEIYCISLTFWHLSDKLAPHPKPNSRFSWNQAVAALQADFLSPSMFTLNSVLLSLSGRPTTSITANAINNGRAVSLAYVLGLNRNSMNWNISRGERHMRTRLWWGVLIHDHWSSLGYGVPFLVKECHYDVPTPTLEMLLTHSEQTSHRSRASSCFIALCSLTKLLGRLLALVYDLNGSDCRDGARQVRNLETSLNEWEYSLPSHLKCEDQELDRSVPGSCSLWLGYLALKLLLCRTALRAKASSQDSLDPDSPGSAERAEERQYQLATLYRAAMSIVNFFCSLTSDQLEGFWLPYTAYHLKTATILLLRCSVDHTSEAFSSSCRASLERFITRLRQARDEDKWDLAAVCLAQNDEFAFSVAQNPARVVMSGNRTPTNERPIPAPNALTRPELNEPQVVQLQGADMLLGPALWDDSQTIFDGFDLCGWDPLDRAGNDFLLDT